MGDRLKPNELSFVPAPQELERPEVNPFRVILTMCLAAPMAAGLVWLYVGAPAANAAEANHGYSPEITLGIIVGSGLLTIAAIWQGQRIDRFLDAEGGWIDHFYE